MSQHEDTVIMIAEDSAHSGKRRRYELLLAALLLLFVLGGTWLQLAFYGVDSWIFIALLNVNAIFMLIILLLVIRNTIKLVMERRRKVFGAQVRTRLVIVFVGLSLFPAVIMFLASNRVVATTVDYWFTNQTESSLQAALDVGRSFYSAAAERLRDHSETIEADLQKNRIKLVSDEADRLLARKQQEYSLTILGAVSPQGVPSSWQTSPDFEDAWRDIRKNINWEHVALNRFGSLLWSTNSADYVIGVLAVDGGTSGYLLSAESIGQGLMSQLDRISKGFEEYAYLKQLKKPLKLSFLLILGLLCLITIFGSIWLAFRLSKQITAPLLALAEGTNRIARGDLHFRLEDTGKDELGLLVQSFNHMAKDLQQNRERITQVNEMLARRNATVAERNIYIEAVLDSVATGVITLDVEGRILTVNKAACSIFNISQPELIEGISPLTMLPPLYAEGFATMLRELKTKPDEHWIRQVDFGIGNRLWKLAIHAVALQDDDGIRAFLAVIEDITEFEKMQRMAAWREVAKRIAHEIKNPLTPIKLSAERLTRRFGKQIDDPVFAQCTDLIIRQVERMQDMVQEFSSFAKFPEITLVPGDVAPLLEEAVALFRTSHRTIEWRLKYDKPLPHIAMDAEALHRVFVNLFTNAAEALDAHANASKDQIGAVDVRAHLDEQKQALIITIADNGPGFTAEEKERVFEPYYSGKTGGTGLGLAIVRSIITDHRAEISVSSSAQSADKEATGSTFTLTFPIYATPHLLEATLQNT